MNKKEKLDIKLSILKKMNRNMKDSVIILKEEQNSNKVIIDKELKSKN